MRYVLAALAAAILLGGRRDGREAAREVTLIRIHRQAECRKGRSGPWTPAAAGTRLTEDDSLRTSNNSYADLQLDPPNRFRLNENALLKVERVFAEEKDAGGSLVRLTDLGLLKGEVIARLDNLPAGTRLSLKSPVAVAAVRGTAFSVTVTGDANATGVAVAGGSVRVEAAGDAEKRVTVGPDRRTTVAPWSGARLRAKGTGLPPKGLLVKRLADPKIPLKDARELLNRLENPSPTLSGLAVEGEGRAAAPADILDPSEAEARARTDARQLAQKMIIEKLGLIMLSGDETLGGMMDRDAGLCRAILDATNGAAVLSSAYTAADRTASVRLSFPLEKVRLIAGREIALAWRGISPVPPAEYSAAFGGFIRAATERAATVDAYRRLAERIYGTVVNSSTTLKDFAVRDDRIEVAVKGVVRGAEEISRTYYSDGSIDVTLELPGAAVKGGLAGAGGLELGEHYVASPSAIEADDFIRLMALDRI